MSKTSKPSRRSGRDASPIARRFPAAPTVSVRARSQIPPWGTPVPAALPIDRRTYNPAPGFTRPALRFSGHPAKVIAAPLRKKPLQASKTYTPAHAPGQLLFQAASGVAVCAQRGIRREVLHAKQVAGKTGLRAPKRGPYSGIKCNNYG